MKFYDTLETILESKELGYQPEPLGFEYTDLEPYLDAETCKLHYEKHYKGYIKKLNELLKNDSSISIEQLVRNIKDYDDGVRFNAGGYYNHSLLWTYLTPKKYRPSDEFLKALNKKYKSYDKFKDAFNEKAMSIHGSGWCWLVVKSGKLDIITTPNQDNPLMTREGRPILGLDCWEHQYYLKYHNRRDKWADAFWKIVNWDVVSDNYSLAMD